MFGIISALVGVMAKTKKTLAQMAAISRMTPMGATDSKGRLLPLRYRVAESKINAMKAAAKAGVK